MVVRWPAPAAEDLTHICDYAEKRFTPAQARRAALLIYEAVSSLKDMPQRGRVGRKSGTRELTVLELRKGNILGPNTTIRDLIEEGRRF
jgi:plasmid stabilization system protein ParE